MSERNQQFINILKLSADTTEQLRSIDLDRIIDEASNQGVKANFIAWLKKQPTSERVHNLLENY